MADHKPRPGELTDDEVSATVANFIKARNGAAYPAEWYRAIATAAYEKAMRRAAEICRVRALNGGVPNPGISAVWEIEAEACAAAIEREAK